MISPLGSRYAIGGALGRSVKRASGGGWWDLNGTITSCVAAYQAKGAASYAASLINLVNSETYTISQTYGTEGWDADIGWTIYANNMRMVTNAPISDLNNRTIIVRSVKRGYGTVFYNNDSNRWWHNYNQYSFVNNASTTAKTITQSVDENHVSALTANGIYLDGSFKDAGTLGSVATGESTCIGNNLSGGLAGETSVAAVAIYTANLTLEQIQALTTAMNAL